MGTSRLNELGQPIGPVVEISPALTTPPRTAMGGKFCEVVDRANAEAAGLASYLRIDPSSASIEIGHIHLAPRLQHTASATEAMYLMMKRVFDCGFRRYEWKCDDLNAPSRSAAARLGFRYEGTFRQATHYKGRNRDTAWFSILDNEWPELAAEFERWLQPDNFDSGGHQRSRLRTNRGR